MTIRRGLTITVLAGLASCQPAQSSSRPAPSAAAVPAAPPAAVSNADAERTAAIRASNAQTVAEIAARIAGRENEPASQVFKNVKFLTDTKAQTFLVIMNVGYADALGVTCAHCHKVQDFSSDEKRPKRAAREMQLMHRSVNTQLGAMTEILSPPGNQRSINCTTCHRGRINPSSPNP